MTLDPGTRLGPYEILGLLGVGGMGEVYRASDHKLKREVAIKVLPEAFAQDEARMKRFEREAQLLASVNHPNIASIYGLEEAKGVRALVMELVEGPTLAERMASGPIPVEESLRIASQIAHGLEAAHERAVIHRDLKPANVKLTKDGDVKILDFGLAKALDVEPPPVEESHSPTLTRATQVGVLLGTAPYMSPEQAKGKPADRRADIWAFGVVLYEMLSGKRPFAGEDVSETLAHILTKEPDFRLLPPDVPRSVRALLARCLTKDPKKRLQAIGEARIALEEPSDEHAPTRQSSFPPALTAVLGLALGLAIWAAWPRPAASPVSPMRLSAELGAEAYFPRNINEEGQAAILSPDGNLLAFVAAIGPGVLPQLYSRRLEDLMASPLPGTEAARNPFFSPDGKWIGFFADGKLKKVAITGGGSLTLAEAFGVYGGTWGEDGAIVFGRDLGEGLARVSAEGGDPELLTNVDAEAGEVAHRWPQVLPDGKGILYTASTRAADANLVVQPLPGGPRKIVLPGGYHGRYLPSGHLVYIREGVLFAVAFDLDRLEVRGRPARAVEDVAIGGATSGARFAYSDRGALVYVPQPSPAKSTIDWVDGAGNREPLRNIASEYGSVRFSVDGKRLATDIRDREQRDVWVYEWSDETLSRLTIDDGDDWGPAWAPNDRVTFASDRADKRTTNLYWQPADGSEEAQRLTVSDYRQWPGSWHPSGKFLAFCEMRLGSASPDVLILPMDGSEESGWKPGKPWVFLDSPRVENTPEFSPDGRWIAYMSNETGTFEVFVRPFPGPGAKRQVSTAGGRFPAWSRTRPEIFYYTPDEKIMVVPYTVAGDKFLTGKSRLWSEQSLPAWGNMALGLHPDGNRLAVISNPRQSAATQDKIVFILNFPEYLRRIAPPSR